MTMRLDAGCMEDLALFRSFETFTQHTHRIAEEVG